MCFYFMFFLGVGIEKKDQEVANLGRHMPNTCEPRKKPWLVGLYRGIYYQLYRDYNQPL